MAELSGLVQRLKWAGGVGAVFVYVGPRSDAVRLLLIQFDAADPVLRAAQRSMAHLLLQAKGAGLPVLLQYDPGTAAIQQLDVRFTTVRPEGLEVTQAIQDLKHSVTLVALKRTVVRAYLSYRSDPPVTVRGVLTVRRLPGGSPVTIPSLNEVVLDSAEFGQLDAQREDIDRSLNFMLPIDQTVPGQLRVSLTRVEDTTTGAALDGGLVQSTVQVTFEATPPLRIRIVGISYDFGTPPTTRIPSALDFALLTSWLSRAYPVAQVISSQTVVPANDPVKFNCGQVNSQVAAIRALDVAGGVDNRTHYYGLVSDSGFFMRGCAAVPGSPDPTAVGSGPTGPATWGWDTDGSYGDWYGGHELGHTFGRQHPGFCGESASDPSYPFDNGQLSDANKAYVGLDVGDPVNGLSMVALPGTEWADVMTYCDNQWLSSYTYEGIRARLIAEDALGGGGAGRPDARDPKAGDAVRAERHKLISVVATVNLTTQTAKIRYVNPVSRGERTRPEPGSPVSLVVRRADGTLLHEVPVPVNLLSDQSPGQGREALVNALVAAPKGARRVELLVNGRVADLFEARHPLPAVRSLRRMKQRRAGCLSMSWESDCSPEDRHTFIVQVSTDGGRTWLTAALGLTRPEADVDLGSYQDAQRLLVRVTETDGFDTAEVTSEPIEVESP